MTNKEAIKYLIAPIATSTQPSAEYLKQKKAYELAIKALERPQGEWVVSQTMDCHSDIINIYTCPFCGKKEYSAYPFCHCGADMRKGGTE